MFRLYTHALSASRIAPWAALILLAAVSWDVMMSGEALTNEGSNLFPRSSRVFVLYGYAILLCGLVLFFTAERPISSGADVEPLFEPEQITQRALPVFAVMLFLRVAPLHGRHARTGVARDA
jgi:hypothetical protein